MTHKIWVYDDVGTLSRGYAARVRKLVEKSGFDVEPMDTTILKEELVELSRRQKALREGEKWPDKVLNVDNAAIFIVDYDLAEAHDLGPFATGEGEVAYPLRCFSGCGLLIGLNQFGDNSFDLTLGGHPESYADINIGSTQIDNVGLWGGVTEGFRPWHWPNLFDYFRSFQEKLKDVHEHINDPICKVLGIEDMIKYLPTYVKEFIGGDPARTTFREFVTGSGSGLKDKDRSTIEPIIERIAAARISKWLERLVLPSQDSLVDAPHLVSRFPSLLKGDKSDVNTWNKTALLSPVEELGLDSQLIEEFEFKKKFWLSRPAWFWDQISNFQKIKEVSEPWEKEATNYVFCEDASRFHDRSQTKEFKVELDSPFTRRFIRYFQPVDYEPKQRYIEPEQNES